MPAMAHYATGGAPVAVVGFVGSGVLEDACAPAYASGGDGWSCLGFASSAAHFGWFDSEYPVFPAATWGVLGGDYPVACSRDLAVAEYASGYPSILVRGATEPVLPLRPSGTSGASVYDATIIEGAVWARADLPGNAELWRWQPGDAAFRRIVQPSPGRAARGYAPVDGKLVWLEGPDDEAQPGPYWINVAPLTADGIGPAAKLRDVPFDACDYCYRGQEFGEGYFLVTGELAAGHAGHLYRVSDGRHWAMPAAVPVDHLLGIFGGEAWFLNVAGPPGSTGSARDGLGRVRLRLDTLGAGD